MADLITKPAIQREPLPIGELAPEFALTSAGEPHSVFRRSQFRGRSGVLLFFAADVPPAIAIRLIGICKDFDQYQKLNVRLLVIVPSQAVAETLLALPFPVLLDPESRTWHAYSTGTESDQADCQYGLFFLDRYGGVDSELVTDDAESLPDAETALEWARYAMYKCIC